MCETGGGAIGVRKRRGGYIGVRTRRRGYRCQNQEEEL